MIIYKENNVNTCKSIGSKCSKCYDEWASGLVERTVKFAKGGIK